MPEGWNTLIVFEAHYRDVSGRTNEQIKYVAFKENWPYIPSIGDRLFFEPHTGTSVNIEAVCWTHDGVPVVKCILWRHSERDVEALTRWGFERKTRPYEDEEQA